MRLRLITLVLCRILVGVTFLIAGWAKAIDPWGFVIKTGEYLDVWKLALPHELIVAACVAIACVEFCTGAMILLGAFKRWAVWTAAAFMVFMLPLTAYIAIADPVDDCGCFGDFLILSNAVTFIKNIILSAAIVYLILRNRTVPGLLPVPIQWMAMDTSVAFPLFLSFVGYNIQPLVDFRPFRTGTTIFSPSYEIGESEYIYEKNGENRLFTLDGLPDSTWTFVDVVEPEMDTNHAASIAVFDEEGNDIAQELAGDESDHIYMIVANPDLQFLTRARFVNELADYGRRHDCPMIGIVGVEGSALDEWKALVRPRFPVYTAEDTSLKMLVRGTGALVFTREGKIVWKRTLASVDTSVLESETEGNALDTLRPVDDGKIHLWACGIYLAVIIVVYLLGQSPKLLPNHKK